MKSKIKYHGKIWIIDAKNKKELKKTLARGARIIK